MGLPLRFFLAWGFPKDYTKSIVDVSDANEQSIIADTPPPPKTFEVKKGQKNVCEIIVERAKIGK
jgi:hypothetical protein